MGSVVPLGRLATRARVRQSLATCESHGVSGCRYCRDATRAWNRAPVLPEHESLDFWPRESLIVRHAWRAVGLLFLACVVLPACIGIGKAFTSFVLAVWG